MKSLIYTVFISMICLLLSCEDYSAETPTVENAEIIEQSTEADGTIKVIFKFKSTAKDDVVVWWGTDDSNYQTYQELISNPGSDEENITEDYPQGESLQDPNNWNGENLIEKVYPAFGVYTMTIIATNVGDFSEDIKQTIFNQTITLE